MLLGGLVGQLVAVTSAIFGPRLAYVNLPEARLAFSDPRNSQKPAPSLREDFGDHEAGRRLGGRCPGPFTLTFFLKPFA